MTDNNTDTKFEDKKQEEVLKKIEEMYSAGVHFGHSHSSSHPKMRPFFCGLSRSVEIFNLDVVSEYIEKAMEFLEELGSRGAKFLIVATKAEARDIVEKTGRELGMPYVTDRWLGGTLTNFEVIKKRIAYFEDLSAKKASGNFSSSSKKEASRLEKQFLKMEKQLGGIKNLKELPSALVVIDSKVEKSAILEAKKKKISVVAILSSDCNPTGLDYPIPANDSSISSLEYLLGKLSEAYKKGAKKFKKEEVKLT